MKNTIKLPISIIYSLVFFMGLFTNNAKAEIEIGKPAPGFELFDQYNKRHSLQDYSGKWVVLYFYPKDDTPGCTTEACNFRDDIFDIRGLGAEVLGVSVDSVDSHANFAKKHGLPFPLLSDAEKTVAEKYNCLVFFGPLQVAKRQTFIINPEGNIAKIYTKVNPKVHSEEVIRDLKAMQTD